MSNPANLYVSRQWDKAKTNTWKHVKKKKNESDILTVRCQCEHKATTPSTYSASPKGLRCFCHTPNNSHAPTHPPSLLGLLDAASSDSIIRRRPAERRRVRMRQKRAQPQQGISKTSHGSQLDSSAASLTAALQGEMC